MHITGSEGGPPQRMAVPVGDLAGGLYSVVGVLAALHDREHTGKGAHVDVGLLDSSVALLSYIAGNYSASGDEPQKVGSGHHSVTPYGAYRAKDEWLVIACFAERAWPKLCRALEREDLIDDERFATQAVRKQNEIELDQILNAELSARTRGEWLEQFDKYDAPGAPINRVSEALNDAQVRYRGMVMTVNVPGGGQMEVPGNPVKFSPPSAGDDLTATYPLLGADTEIVLHDILGWDPTHIAELARRGTIALGPGNVAEREGVSAREHD
jgi:CoA:oxalate CoA-transferase